MLAEWKQVGSWWVTGLTQRLSETCDWRALFSFRYSQLSPFLGPFMVYYLLPRVPNRGFGSHPCRVGSIRCAPNIDPLSLPNVEWDFAKKHEGAWKVLRE